MRKRSLTTLIFLVIATMAMTLPAEAKFLGDLGYMLFGGTREYVKPGITVNLAGIVSPTMVKHPAFTHQPINADEATASKGTKVIIDVLILAKRIDGREFVVAVSDPAKTVRTSELKGKLPNSPLGGMQILNKFSGLYGQATWDTGSASEGLHFVYVFVSKGGEYQPQDETAIPVWVGPSFGDIERGGVDSLTSDELSGQGMEMVKESVSPPPPPAPSVTVEAPRPQPTQMLAMTLILSGKSHFKIPVSIPDNIGVEKGSKFMFTRGESLTAWARVTKVIGNVIYANHYWGKVSPGDAVILQERGGK